MEDLLRQYAIALIDSVNNIRAKPFRNERVIYAKVDEETGDIEGFSECHPCVGLSPDEIRVYEISDPNVIGEGWDIDADGLLIPANNIDQMIDFVKENGSLYDAEERVRLALQDRAA